MRTLICASSLLLLASLPSHGQIWDKNLVVNGNAESGTGVTTIRDAAVKNIPGWTTTGNFTLCQFGNGIPVDVRWLQGTGKQYFAGGPGGGAATAKQTIDLSAGANEIDAGQVRFFLSAVMATVDLVSRPTLK